MSRPPSGGQVATQTKGERSTNWRVRPFRRSDTFATMRSLGEPRISRRCVSVEIVATLRV
jgi:hypothetical protein